MASDEAIAALRSQIDSILQSPASHSGSRRANKRSIPSANKASATELAFAEGDRSSGLTSDDAFKKVLALLNASDKSERMIRERLHQLDFGESAIESAVARAKECGFLDDVRYGEVLVRSRVAQGKGSAGIERELFENDIDPNEIPGYPEEFGIDPTSEFERALALLKRKPPHAKNARDAAYRKLVQKGFPVSVASSAARVWYDARETL